MRAVRGRITSSVFIIGIAMLAASLAELEVWPALAVRMEHSDVRFDLTSRERPAIFERFGPEIDAEMRLLLITLVVAAAVGAAFSLRTLTVLAVICGAVVGLEWVAYVTAYGSTPASTHCWDFDYVPNEHHFDELRLFALVMATIIGANWLVEHRRRKRALPIVLVGVLVAMFASTPVVVALLTCVALLMNRRPHLVSKGASALALMIGLTAAVPAIAMAHDAAAPLNEHLRYFDDHGRQPLRAMKSCLEPRAGPSPFETDAKSIRSDLDWVRAFFNERGTPFNAAVKFPQGREFTLSSIVTAVQVLDEYDDENRVVQIIQPRPEPAGLWMRDAFHIHAGAVNLELDPRGVSISEFTSIEGVIEAADAHGGTLLIRP